MSSMLITHKAMDELISGVFLKHVCARRGVLDADQKDVKALSHWRWTNPH